MWIAFSLVSWRKKTRYQGFPYLLKAFFHPFVLTMTASAKSVYFFGLYLYGVAVPLVFFPNHLLRLMGIAETNEVWIRILGVLVGLIGFYYHRNGIAENRIFFKLTVPARIAVLVSFVLFVALKMASPMLIGFGVVDALGAFWTWRTLQAERRQ